ncbi:MAG TPA: hypothetical protein VLY85_04965 [Thermoplasmata archaeon]|nr:hypothetical protein [Thermoplasmata archaeon]
MSRGFRALSLAGLALIFAVSGLLVPPAPSGFAAPASGAAVPLAALAERSVSPASLPGPAPNGASLAPSGAPHSPTSASRSGGAGSAAVEPVGFRSIDTSSAPAPAAAAKKPPNYSWSSAYIGYSNSDPASLLFGEGTGSVSDNALDEVVWFGGLATGGLSNVTLIYNWWYNTTNLFNSSEGWNYTTSPTSPSARTNMSFGAYQTGQVALLFGGLTNLRTQRTANDTWLYYFPSDTWVNVTRPGGPPPREGAAFAVDQKDGIGLLFGGIAPSFTSHGSTGAVIWRDTWVFSFATDRWTEIATPVSPSERFGASMVWDSVDDEFLLVGGCSLACTMDAWSFDPATLNWSELPETGHVPPARAFASFAWDPGAGLAVLYGGLTFDGNGNALAYSDSYRFLPTGEWQAMTPASAGPPPLYQPGALYDASTTWSNFPDCDVMWIMGGNPSLSAVPYIAYVIQPSNDSPDIQCWWWWAEIQGPPGNVTPCSHTSELIVTIEDVSSRIPIPQAIITISGECLPAIGITNPAGSFEFTLVTPDNITLNVSAAGYHGNRTWYNYTYTNTTQNTSGTLVRYLLIYLEAYPHLNVQVVGNNGGVFLTPVPYAPVSIANSTVVAVTGLTGWGNASGIVQFNQTVTVSATATNYSSSWKLVRIPYTGEVNTTLIIQKAGYLTVRILDARHGGPIEGAKGEITRLDPGLPAPFSFLTPGNGTYTVQLPLGNYSATATAKGYLPNTTGAMAYLPWVHNSTITLQLTLDYGTNASVRLRDADTGAPIFGGAVTFGESSPYATDSQGWANATNLGPPGPAKVIGAASGYASNSTFIQLRYDWTVPPITLNLTPLCPGAACPPRVISGGSGVSPLLPAGGSALSVILAAPIFLLIAGVIYVLTTSARRARFLPPARVTASRYSPERGGPV